MRIHLLRLSFIAILAATFTISYGQGVASGNSLANIKEPLFVLNSYIIANGLTTHLNPQSCKDIIIHKGQDAPSQLKNLSSSGIIDIIYGEKVLSESFADIGTQLGLHGPLNFVINGHTLDATQVATLRISPEAIEHLAVTPATPSIAETIVTIRLVEPKAVNRPRARGDNKPDIMIR